MGVTVQVRDLDQEVSERLKAAAASKGLSYSEYLRRELTRIAEGLRIADRWAALTTEREARQGEELEKPRPRFEPTPVDTETIVRWIREGREGR
jgi:plasmid stability protein